MNVIILESPNPMDLILKRDESASLEKICKLFGHNITSFFITSSRSLQETLNYISSIDEDFDNEDKTPLCIHISCHGN